MVVYSGSNTDYKSSEPFKTLVMLCYVKPTHLVTRLHKIRNDDIRQALGSQTTLLVERRLRWFGYVEKMSIDWIPHNALHARFAGNRNKGRPRLRWIDNVKEDIESIGLTLRWAIDLTKDRGQWRSFIRIHRRQMAGVRNWWWWGFIMNETHQAIWGFACINIGRF